MTTNTKHTLHKSCSCRQCKFGRGTKAGQDTQHANEKKLRQLWKKALRRLGIEDADAAPISSPYTD
jgi:hypothetical protein